MPRPFISGRVELATGEIATVGRPPSEGRLQFPEGTAPFNEAGKGATVAGDLFGTVGRPSSGAFARSAPLRQVHRVGLHLGHNDFDAGFGKPQIICLIHSSSRSLPHA